MDRHTNRPTVGHNIQGDVMTSPEAIRLIAAIDAERPRWVADAACRGVTQRMFFDRGASKIHVERALAICGRCTVKDECLRYGIDEVDGVWGGTTPAQRVRIRKLLRRQWGIDHKNPVMTRFVIRCGTTAGYTAHWRAGEPACDACRQAHAANQYKEARKDRAS